jgi:D-sedoheptulose 7-phosphate isomerase
VFANLDGIRPQIEAASALIESTVRSGRRVFACGNGGSAAEAQHFVTELVGRYKTNRAPLPAVWLGGDTGQMSCIANDFSWDDVFSRPLRALAQPGDIVLALSTSGRSPNVVRCLEVASELGLKSVALLGNGGGAAAHHASHPVIVPATGTARVQEAHLFLIHTFCDALERHYASQ